jgi:hypothetical protein
MNSKQHLTNPGITGQKYGIAKFFQFNILQRRVLALIFYKKGRGTCKIFILQPFSKAKTE